MRETICRHEKENNSMKNKPSMILAVILVSIFGIATISEAESMKKNGIKIQTV